LYELSPEEYNKQIIEIIIEREDRIKQDIEYQKNN
jgi:hypothetical protein